MVDSSTSGSLQELLTRVRRLEEELLIASRQTQTRSPPPLLHATGAAGTGPIAVPIRSAGFTSPQHSQPLSPSSPPPVSELVSSSKTQPLHHNDKYSSQSQRALQQSDRDQDKTSSSSSSSSQKPQLQLPQQSSEQDKQALLQRQEENIAALISANKEVKVRLNVGGKRFTTTSTTLCIDPNSMLAAMFSGRYKLQTDEEGCFFIDRPGDLFEIVLYFLRTSKLPPDLSDAQMQVLQEEATYYGLASMAHALQEYHSWKTPGHYPPSVSSVMGGSSRAYLQKPSEFITCYSLAPLARPNTINEVNKILREGYRVKHLLENDGFLYVVYHLVASTSSAMHAQV